MIVAQITAKFFCAGIVLEAERVTKAAPIISYMRGWTRDHVRDECARRGWSIRVVEGILQ